MRFLLILRDMALPPLRDRIKFMRSKQCTAMDGVSSLQASARWDSRFTPISIMLAAATAATSDAAQVIAVTDYF